MKRLILWLNLCSSASLLANYQKGLKSFKDEEYADAANYFYIEWSKGTKPELKQKALAGLAESLSNMDLYYSAAHYYSLIIKQTKDQNQAVLKKAFLKLAKIQSNEGLGQSYLNKIFTLNMDPANIPGAARGFYFYYLAVNAYEEQKYNDAEKYFARVQPETEYYVKSRFYLAVIYNLTDRKSKAFDLFDKILDLAKNEGNANWILEQTNLNMARILYEQQKYAESITYFAKIPRESENWLEALFEAAWAFFLMEKPNNALGNLHTLLSPFFSTRFFPETYILQAITYLRMCRYDEIKISLDGFKNQYGPVMRDLKSILKQSENDSDKLFQYVYEYQNKTLNQFEEMLPIFDSLARSDTFKQALETLSNTDEESQRLDSAPSEWQDSGFLKNLENILKDVKKNAKIDSSARLLKLANYYNQYLIDLDNQTKMITAELMLGKVDDLRSQIVVTEEKRKVNFIGGMQELKVGEKLEYWPFEGEYWEDELGGYVFNLESKCNK